MEVVQKISVGLIAFLHLGFLYLEMVLWAKPLGQKIFRLDPDFAQKSASLAANQGLYNGFLAAGLIWSLCTKDPVMSFQLKLFFLGCVLVAGIFGAVTASRNILFLQALPAFVVLALVYFTR